MIFSALPSSVGLVFQAPTFVGGIQICRNKSTTLLGSSSQPCKPVSALSQKFLIIPRASHAANFEILVSHDQDLPSSLIKSRIVDRRKRRAPLLRSQNLEPSKVQIATSSHRNYVVVRPPTELLTSYIEMDFHFDPPQIDHRHAQQRAPARQYRSQKVEDFTHQSRFPSETHPRIDSLPLGIPTGVLFPYLPRNLTPLASTGAISQD